MGVVRSAAMWITTSTLLIYVVIAMFEAVYAFASTVKPALLPQSKQAHIDVLLRGLHRPSVRQRLLELLQVPSITLAWPLWLVRNRQRFLDRRNNLAFSAQMVLEPTNVLIAAATLTLLVIIDIVNRLDALWAPIVRIAVIIVLAATVARHVGYLFGSLPEQLRQSRRSPYASLLTIALLDGASLVLSVTLLRMSVADRHSTAADLRESIVQLFDVAVTIGSLVQLEPPDVLALPGLIFSAALINAARSPKEFHRTDDDLRKLATHSIHIGEFDQAKDWLAGEKSRNFESLFIRARLAVAQGRFEEAERLTSRGLAEQSVDDSFDAVVVGLMGLTQLTPLADSQYREFIAYLMRRRASDALVCVEAEAISVVVQDPSRIAAELLDSVEITQFPLTQAFFLAYLDDWPRAREVLDQARPGSEPEEFLRLLHQCHYACVAPGLSVPETHAYIVDWFATSFPAMDALTRDLAGAYRVPVLVSVLETRISLQRFYTHSAAEMGPAGADLTDKLTDLASGLAESELELSKLTRGVENLTALQLPAD